MSLVSDPVAPGTLFVATSHNGVFKSIDSGTTWLAANVGLPRRINHLAIAADGTLFAAGSEELHRSADGGASWQSVLSQPATALVTDPSSALVAYIGILETRVFKTVDGGESWTSSENGLGSVAIQSLVVDPATPDTLYAGSDSEGVFKSTDGGASWTKKDTGIEETSILSLALDPLSPQKLFVSTSEGLFSTVDGAETWTPLAATPPAFVPSLSLDPLTPATLYGSRFGRVFTSTDSGATWTEPGTVPPVEILDVVRGGSPSSLFLLTGSGVYVSHDGAASWLATNSGLRAVVIDTVAVDASNPDTIVASSPESGIYKTTDGGDSWLPVSQGLSDWLVQDFGISTSMPTTLFTAPQSGLFTSVDGAATWTNPVTDPEDFGYFGPAVASLAIDPTSPALVLAMQGGIRRRDSGPGILRSLDGAATWDRALEFTGLSGLQLGEIAIDPITPSRALASLGGLEVASGSAHLLLFRSSNAGLGWTEVYRQDGAGFSRLSWDPVTSGTAYTLVGRDTDYEILRSLNGGVTWNPYPSTATCVNEVVPDLTSPGTIWLACNPIWMSTDDGATWDPFDMSGLPANAEVLTLTLAPDPSAALHAGTNSGVWSYSFSAPTDLAITKDDGVTELDPGASLTYALVASNVGPGDAVGATVTDTLPSDLTCTWSCVPAGGAACTTTPPAGDLDELVDLPVGGTATFTASCTVSASAGGFLTNTATIAAPDDRVDLEPANDSASDTDVVLETGGCGEANDRILGNVTLDTPQEIVACLSITAQADVSVAADVTLRAPLVRFDEIAVASGSLTVANELP